MEAKAKMFFDICQLLPPANEVCEGYVFTPACQSFCSRGGVSRPTHRERLRGLARGVSKPTPTPRGRLGGLAGGSSGPHPAGSRPTPGGCPGQGTLAQVQGGGSQHALRQTTPPADGYCCGQYASYWNAFLLSDLFCLFFGLFRFRFHLM